ncbi:MAG: radical SAM (seleno)protein TrsS, partial [Desulfovibrionaceae bacterium]
WTRPKTPSFPRTPRTAVRRGCPLDCGLCPEHGQHTCTALREITWRCDLGCPVCFASSGDNAPPDPPLAQLAWQLDQVLAASGRCNVQLSGGEPSVRDDLPEIVALAKARFPFVQLNTNGLRAAREPGFAPRLAAAGLDSVFLQFDGLSDDVYQRLRGRPLWEIKQAALERFVAAGIGVVLVPTLVPGVNDRQVGDLLRFAAAHAPGVRGLHFQPVSYFGRYPAPPADADRITLPEVMRALEEQTHGLVHAADFLPPGCEHSRCSFHANYLVREDGGLTRLSGNGSCGCRPADAAAAPVPAPPAPIVAAQGADQSKAFVSRQWAAPRAGLTELTPSADDLDRFLARARTHILAVSAMAFQDAWTLDLDRLRGCCIHVSAPDGRLIPFCAYNLTAADGAPLYRRTSGRTA